MIEDLKNKIDEKSQLIDNLREQISNTENDCNDLSELCQKQLEEIERLNTLNQESLKQQEQHLETIEDYKSANIQIKQEMVEQVKVIEEQNKEMERMKLLIESL